MRTTRGTRRALVVAALVVCAAGCSSSAAKQSAATAPVVASSSTALPATTVPATMPTSTLPNVPTRHAVTPVQTGAMPAEAFVADGPALVAIDTHDPAKRRTLTTFPGDSGIGWITVDQSYGRVFFGVTSGCDPGVNGMYEMSAAGGVRHKIAAAGNRAAVSPDGTKLAYSVSTDGCGSENLVVQNVASGQVHMYLGHRDVSVGGWSPDGQSVLIVSYDKGNPAVFRFRPFVAGAQLDRSAPWDTGIAADSGGGRVAIMDGCPGDSPSGVCKVRVRTRNERGSGSDYDFGTGAPPADLSLDASGQWPLVVRDNPSHQVVSYFSAGSWHDLAPGNAADW